MPTLVTIDNTPLVAEARDRTTATARTSETGIVFEVDASMIQEIAASFIEAPIFTSTGDGVQMGFTLDGDANNVPLLVADRVIMPHVVFMGEVLDSFNQTVHQPAIHVKESGGSSESYKKAQRNDAASKSSM
ncbi:hypothetical protein DXG01_013893 [Tephrocybe rancida]|nr:hypothetical protein DXG01_013893 [Tephrocybe rancida]